MGKSRRPSSIDLAGIFGACNKQRYPHRRAAEEAKARSEARAAAQGEPVELAVYECDRSYCGGWHLTSSPSKH